MGSRLALIACQGTYQTPWFPFKGDERTIEVLGSLDSVSMELVYETQRGTFDVPLHFGQNPFPKVHGIKRYQFTKLVLGDGPEVSNSIKIHTR